MDLVTMEERGYSPDTLQPKPWKTLKYRTGGVLNIKFRLWKN